MIDFIKNSYHEFIHYVDRPSWSDIIVSVRLVAVFTLVLLILLYGIDSFFSTFLENFYSLLKKIKE